MTKYIQHCLFLCLAIITLAGCASSEHKKLSPGEYIINDPFEGYNRAMFSFNRGLDEYLFNPVVKVYRAGVPQVARKGVHNFLDNLSSPAYLANEILQGDFEGAGEVIRRFLINTFAGFGGLLNIPEDWENEGPLLTEDFGQTLAVWGFSDGIYFVWPIIGPVTTRDSIGRLVDPFFDPLTWMAMNDPRKDWISVSRAGVTFLDTKDLLLEPIDDLEAASTDFYAAVRSIIYQRRAAMIADQVPSDFATSIEIPDFDDY